MTRRMAAALALGTINLSAILSAQHAFAGGIASQSPIDHWQNFIDEASRRFGIPEAWIRGVMRAESGGQAMLNGHPTTSRAGAMGVMQVMPETYAELRGRYGLGTDAYDPHDNILAGTAYLRELYQRYGYPNLFAAYNAGPTRFDKHLLGGQPLPDETVAYLATLGQPSFEPPKQPAIPSERRLFFTLRTVPGGVSEPSGAASSDGLFVPIKTAQ